MYFSFDLLFQKPVCEDACDIVSIEICTKDKTMVQMSGICTCGNMKSCFPG